MNERDEVLCQFAVASDVPNEDLIAEYVAKFPEYEHDIRCMAAELQKMHGQEEIEIDIDLSPEEEAKLNETIALFTFRYYEILFAKQGKTIGHA